MKLKLSVFLLINIFLINKLSGLDSHYSKSVAFIRPAYANVSANRAVWQEFMYPKEENSPARKSFQVIGFYQKTLDTQSDFAEYFLLKNKPTLTVKGDTVSTIDRDIRAEWLSLDTNFNGSFSINPTQEQYALTLDFKKDLGDLFGDISLLKNIWLGVYLPIVRVKNNLNLTQSTTQASSTSPTDIKTSLARDTLTYNKFITGEKTSTDLSEIRLKIGTKFFPNSDLDLSAHSFFSLPLSNKSNGQTLFQPISGFNRHFMIGSSVGLQFPVNSKDANYSLKLFLDAEHMYLVSNNQYRTFDLKNKPLSRFLLLNQDSTYGQKQVFGPTILTRRAKIEPNSVGEISLGARYKNKSIAAELGYNLWGHGTEELELVDTFTTNYGIAGSSLTNSASASDINTLASDDSSFTAITASDLDLKSGSAGSVVTHKIQGSISFVFNKQKNKNFLDKNLFMNFGGFYELPQNNAAPKQWGIWAKLGADF